jgi:hypothetical protein
MAALAATGWAAGCTESPTARPPASAVELAAVARNDAAKLPPSPEKEALVARLDHLNQVLSGAAANGDIQLVTAERWYALFGPKSVVVDPFTKFADLDAGGSATAKGLEVRVRLKDAFDDPVKALGSFRVQLYEYVPRSLETRGGERGNWLINILSEQDIRKYYDVIDRSFRFPLKLENGLENNKKIIVEVTYYLPDGSGDKMFAKRTITVGK